ncbi:MAG: efflux RND transporter periplasmic adaptor subunit [candidate division Zixibacteria bacterium]|nr:efflux RND transporter periplasmic adaptor subunit [candidate division Zixibacteria bacterium]
MAGEYPSFRKDLIISQQEYEGKTYYVIKDPITRKFFRVKEPEYFITQNLDGTKSNQEIIQEFERKFQVKLDLTTLESFLNRLEKLGFLEGEISQRELSKLQYEAEKKKSLLKKILFIKIKAFDPDKFLDRLLKKFRFVYTKGFLLFSLAVIFLALVVTISNWEDAGYSFKKLFALTTIVKLWLAIFLIALVHELGHALTCKYFGGEVREMGFLLIYFQPAFFTNVSDAWMFKEKRKKLLVSWAGIYIHLFLWACVTLLWRITDLETQLNSFLFVVMVASGVLILFNFNPLIKLDGYYLLSDWLEIPNLRKKAFGYLGSIVKNKILRVREKIPEVTARDKKIFPLYGTLSIFYSFVLILYFFLKVGNFLISRYQGFGFALFLVILYFIFQQPLKILLAGGFHFFLIKKEGLMKPKKIFIYGGVIILILILLFIVKLDLKISQECEFAAMERYSIVNSPSAGFIEEQLYQEDKEEKRQMNVLRLISSTYGIANLEPMVKEGQRVKKGQVIVRVFSNQYINELEENEAAIRKEKANLELLEKGARPEEIAQAKEQVRKAEAKLESNENELKRLKELFSRNLISKEELEKKESEHTVLAAELGIAQNNLKILLRGAKKEEIDMSRAEISRLEAKAKFYKDQIASSDFKSPISGIVTSVQPEGNLLSIANYDTIRVLMPVSEKDLDVIKSGQKVKAKVRSFSWKTFYGVVTRIAYQAEQHKSRQVFLVTSRIDNSELLLKPGMTGQAKIYCGKRSIAYLLLRRIISWIRVEVWSWF